VVGVLQDLLDFDEEGAGVAEQLPTAGMLSTADRACGEECHIIGLPE